MKKIILIFSCILILLNLFGCRRVDVNKNYIDKNTCEFEVEFLDKNGCSNLYDGIVKIYPANYDTTTLIESIDYYIIRDVGDESDVPFYSIAVGIVPPNMNEYPLVYIRHSDDYNIPRRWIDNLEEELSEKNINLDNITNKVIKFVKDKYKDID